MWPSPWRPSSRRPSRTSLWPPTTRHLSCTSETPRGGTSGSRNRSGRSRVFRPSFQGHKSMRRFFRRTEGKSPGSCKKAPSQPENHLPNPSNLSGYPSPKGRYFRDIRMCLPEPISGPSHLSPPSSMATSSGGSSDSTSIWNTSANSFGGISPPRTTPSSSNGAERSLPRPSSPSGKPRTSPTRRRWTRLPYIRISSAGRWEGKRTGSP